MAIMAVPVPPREDKSSYQQQAKEFAVRLNDKDIEIVGGELSKAYALRAAVTGRLKGIEEGTLQKGQPDILDKLIEFATHVGASSGDKIRALIQDVAATPLTTDIPLSKDRLSSKAWHTTIA